MDIKKYHDAQDMMRDIMNLAVCMEKLGSGSHFKDYWSTTSFNYIYQYDRDFYEKVLDTIKTMVEKERTELYNKFESL